MGKLDDTGVYQLKGGNWAYRYTITENGRKKDVRKAKDDNGNPFNTKREAIKARLIAIGREQEGNKPKPKDRKTIAEVYDDVLSSHKWGVGVILLLFIKVRAVRLNGSAQNLSSVPCFWTERSPLAPSLGTSGLDV